LSSMSATHEIFTPASASVMPGRTTWRLHWAVALKESFRLQTGSLVEQSENISGHPHKDTGLFTPAMVFELVSLNSRAKFMNANISKTAPTHLRKLLRGKIHDKVTLRERLEYYPYAKVPLVGDRNNYLKKRGGQALFFPFFSL